MLYCVVLAGGRSSRMGRDKAGLELDGETLLQHSLRLLQDSGAGQIFISGRVEGHDWIPDLYPGSGPPGGVLSTLDWIRKNSGLDDSLLLVIPVDMPLLTVDVLRKLTEGCGDAAAARFPNEVFPCVFRTSEALYRHLRELFEESTEPGGKRSMKALFDFTQAKQIDRLGLPDGVFMNINYPEEWEEFLTTHKR